MGVFLRRRLSCRNRRQQGWIDEFPRHEHEVENAKSRQNSSDPGLIENARYSQRKPRQQQAPRRRPGQHYEHQAGIHEIAHVDHDQEESAQLHHAIIYVSRVILRTALPIGIRISNFGIRIFHSTCDYSKGAFFPQIRNPKSAIRNLSSPYGRFSP